MSLIEGRSAMRKPLSHVKLFLLILILLLTHQWCGRKHSDSETIQESPAAVPSDWDGLSDYQNSALPFQDLE